MTAEVYGSALFNCVAKGDPEPKVFWFFTTSSKKTNNWIPAQNLSNAEKLSNGSLVIKDVSKENEAWYKCMAGNSGFIVERMAFLKVIKGLCGFC